MYKQKLPNFLIAGVAKSGTTFIYHYLKQHPDIFISPRKECRFFSQMGGDFVGPGSEYPNDIIKGIEDYVKLFEGVKNEKAIGDISNDYLYFYKNPEKEVRKICKFLKKI